MRRTLTTSLLVAVTLLGCDSGADSTTEVRIGFKATTGASAIAKMQATALDVPGDNGTLHIDDVRLIVAEFELEGDDDCAHTDASGADQSVESDDGEDSHEDCAEFKTGPFFLDLPLEETAVTVTTTAVDPGTYDKVQFEVEDLESDDANDAPNSSLLDEIREDFPAWPREASMLVVGSFEDNTGAFTEFRVYIEAEIEVEIDLPDPLVITGDETDQTVTVTVDPSRWFSSPSGDVVDLSAYDFDTTGELLDLEFEVEHGFEGAEIEHD